MPATEERFQLIVVEGQPLGEALPLDGREVVLGRDPECPLPLGGPGISRRHARVFFEAGRWVIEDLESTNGIRVGNEQVKRKVLDPGDRVGIGSVKLLFRPVLAEEAEMPATPIPPSPAKPVAPVRVPSTPVPVVPAVAEAPTAAPPRPAREAGAREAPRGEPSPRGDPTSRDVAAVQRLRAARERILQEIGKAIVGQKEALDLLLTALFARGHCLLVGVPGLAKTLMVRSLASLLHLDSKRVQFTPDLMPSDITGTEILEEDPVSHQRTFRFVRGPIFANLLLADEINRTPPKTQSALLEAMQEYRVTAGGKTYDLPQPFFVLATQNPLEQEGTYPLPEAQLDRFMFEVRIEYPARAEEIEILRSTTADVAVDLPRVLTADEILDLQHTVRRIPVSAHVAAYAADLVRASRPQDASAPAFVKEWLSWGAGPRAGQYLLLAAKARAALAGRFHATADDVRAAALPVMRHRLFLNFAAASEGVAPETVVQKLLSAVKEPPPEAYRDRG